MSYFTLRSWLSACFICFPNQLNQVGLSREVLGCVVGFRELESCIAPESVSLGKFLIPLTLKSLCIKQYKQNRICRRNVKTKGGLRNMWSICGWWRSCCYFQGAFILKNYMERKKIKPIGVDVLPRNRKLDLCKRVRDEAGEQKDLLSSSQ